MRTEAWWVCGTCKKPVARVGRKKKVDQKIEEHLKNVCPKSGFSIRQVPQSKEK